jgi:adenylate cyclase
MKRQAKAVTITTDPMQPLPDWPELSQQRRAIVVVDVVESVRLMQANEADVIDRWRRFVNEVRTEVLTVHGGRLVKSLGDGLLLEFETVSAAVASTFDIQKRIRNVNSGRDAVSAMYLRIGVHWAEVVVDELDIYGSGVNLAARLASLAGPGQVVASAEARDQVVHDVDADVEDLGDCFVKHIQQPVRAYRLVGDPADAPSESMIEADSCLLPIVAVVPFQVRDSEARDQVIGCLVAEDTIAAMSRSANWRVVSSLSTAAFQQRTLSTQAVARTLNANYVVTGRYSTAAGRVSISIELTEARSEFVMWSKRFEARTDALLVGDDPTVDEIVSNVGQAILSQELRRARTLPLRSLESYTLLMAAVNIMHRASAHEFDRARLMLEYLIERHPRLPAAHSWLGKWYGIRAAQGWSNDLEQDAARATDHVQRALWINEDDALAWTIDGLIRGYIRKDLKGAALSYERALQSNPNEPLAWLYSATLHAWQDDGVRAKDAANRALSLSPLDPMRYYFDSLTSTAYLVASDYARAIESANRSLRANRAHASTYRTLAIAQMLAGHVDEARLTVEALSIVEPGLTVSRFRDRYPGRASRHAQQFCEALQQAGVPA